MIKWPQIPLIALGVLSLNVMAKPINSEEVAFVPGEVLVKVKSGHMGKFLAKKSLLGAEVVKELKFRSGQYILLKTENKSSQRLVSELQDLPEVVFAEPNYLYKPIMNKSFLSGLFESSFQGHQSSLAPMDPLYGKLWGMNNTGANEPDRSGGTSSTPGVSGADIDAEKAWTVTRGSKNVVIAVIDTGIDYNHPDLKNNMWVNEKEIPGNGIDDDGNGYIDDIYGWNAEKDNGNPMDGNTHGTHCAGTIGAEHNNGIGVAGVMGEVSLMAVKFLSDSGSGSLADAIEAIDYATKMKVDVMSNSWGGGGFSQGLEDAIKAAKNKGIVFVAAAGNESSNNDAKPSYPASYQVDNVISVASHTAQDTLSSFSCYGKRSVHVAAPGSNILSTAPNNQYKVLSGTSMATPHVSGAVGLLLSETGRLPVAEVRQRLMATSDAGGAYRRTTQGRGRLNLYNLITNTTVTKPGPDENAWRTESLSEVFETSHPYADNSKMSQTFRFPGARYVKLVIEKYDTESGYDFLSVKDGHGVVVEKISGRGENYETDYAETDSVTVEFTSDSSQNRWGVLIKEVKVIY